MKQPKSIGPSSVVVGAGGIAVMIVVEAIVDYKLKKKLIYY